MPDRKTVYINMYPPGRDWAGVGRTDYWMACTTRDTGNPASELAPDAATAFESLWQNHLKHWGLASNDIFAISWPHGQKPLEVVDVCDRRQASCLSPY